jgi:putative N6-adenine-specific DNA methylase
MGKLSCYAVVVPGLEAIVADELKELAAHDVQVEQGGISFNTTMDGLFRINLRARCVTRILLRLAEFKALSFPELYNKTGRVPWQRYITHKTEVDVRASCHASKLMHSGRTEQAVADAIRDRCQQQKVAKVWLKLQQSEENSVRQQIRVRLHNNVCTLSLDTSGDRLDRRGYRLHSGKAPLRETIAASILRWMDWHADQPLLSPMCGSGTFAIEAAWMAEKRASGSRHLFPFVHWPTFRGKRWRRVADKTVAMQCKPDARIIATELDAGIIRQARGNAEQAGVGDVIHFEQLDVRKLSVPENILSHGLIVCNPPYGDRIKGNVTALYKDIGYVFRTSFSGWRMAVIVPDQGCEKALALQVQRRLKIKHGGKWVHVLHVE